MYRAYLLSTFALAASLCATAPLPAGEREDAEARAALELSLAIGRKAPAPAPRADHAKRADYSTAYYAAIKSGKPLLIHVSGFDCLDACRECVSKGECITCDAVALFDSKAPRMILAIPSGDKLILSREWKTIPTKADVSAALKRAAEVCAAGECLPGR